jgi:hypothetical protein
LIGVLFVVVVVWIQVPEHLFRQDHRSALYTLMMENRKKGHSREKAHRKKRRGNEAPTRKDFGMKESHMT